MAGCLLGKIQFDALTSPAHTAAHEVKPAPADFKTCIQRRRLCAALASHGKPRCKRGHDYEVAQVVMDYTFGHDEISQTVDDGTTTTTHVFGHDGHGSVRVLYDLATTAANITQAFSFSAYGEMIALHNATAQSIAVTNRLSSLGYSGEHFDAKAQQQYLRARWYNPANGRFNRLDPFAGNMQDPQSLHKYAYVHGDPIQGVDPTGMFLGSVGSLGAIGIAMEMHIGTLTQGALTITTLNTIGDAGMQIRRMGIAMIASGDIEGGFALYDLGGSIFGMAVQVIDTANNAIDMFSLGIASVGILSSAYKFLSKGGLRKVGQAFRNLSKLSEAGRSATSFAADLGGKRLGSRSLKVEEFKVWEELVGSVKQTRSGKPMRVQILRRPPGHSDLTNATGGVVRGKYSPVEAGGAEVGTIYVREDATHYEVLHEIQHMMHHFDVGDAHRTMPVAQREWAVYNRMKNSYSWDKLTDLERADAKAQLDLYPVDVPPPHLQ